MRTCRTKCGHLALLTRRRIFPPSLSHRPGGNSRCPQSDLGAIAVFLSDPLAERRGGLPRCVRAPAGPSSLCDRWPWLTAVHGPGWVLGAGCWVWPGLEVGEQDWRAPDAPGHGEDLRGHDAARYRLIPQLAGGEED